MKEKEILARLKSAIDDAPIDLLDKLKDAEVEEMTSHDHITSQDWQIEDNPPKNQAGNEGFLAERIIPISKYLRSFVIAASLVLVVSISTNHYLNMPIGEIYLDINPSFSVEIKRNNKVKEIHPLNADAFEVVNGVTFEDMTYDEALIALVKLAEDEGYMKEDINLIMLSSSSEMADRVDVSAEGIKDTYKDSSTNITILKQNLDNGEYSANGFGTLLERIAENENLPLDYMKSLDLEELLIYLLSNGVDIYKYVDVEGNLPKEETERTETEATETERTETEARETERTETEATEPVQTEAIQTEVPAYVAPAPAPAPVEDDYYDDDYYEDDYDDDYYEDDYDDDYDDDYYEDDYDDDYDDDWDDDDGDDDWDDDDGDDD